nr:MerR family DNA-binding transcriptional regulator [Paenibacillus sp. JJ-100]
MQSTHYSIGKFAQLSGVPIRTLHYYEEVGYYTQTVEITVIGFIVLLI